MAREHHRAGDGGTCDPTAPPAALLGSGVAIAFMVMPDQEEPAATKPRADGAAVQGAQATQPALTKAQKRARKAAVAKLGEDGYEPVRLSDWRPRAQLKVLVGRQDTGAMRAFFFADGRFIAHDDDATSTNVRVAKASSSAVTLAYKLTDGTTTKVKFEWRDGTLTPLGDVPPASLR